MGRPQFPQLSRSPRPARSRFRRSVAARTESLPVRPVPTGYVDDLCVRHPLPADAVPTRLRAEQILRRLEDASESSQETGGGDGAGKSRPATRPEVGEHTRVQVGVGESICVVASRSTLDREDSAPGRGCYTEVGPLSAYSPNARNRIAESARNEAWPVHINRLSDQSWTVTAEKAPGDRFSEFCSQPTFSSLCCTRR